MVGPCGVSVEREFRVPLVGMGDKALEDGDFADKPRAERHEVVGVVFRCRQRCKLEVGVLLEPPDDIGRRNPRLAHASEGFDDLLPRPMLEVQGDTELGGGRVEKVQVPLGKREEDSEVDQLLRHRGDRGRDIRSKTSCGVRC